MRTAMTLRRLTRRTAFWGIVGLLPVTLALDCPALNPPDPNSPNDCGTASVQQFTATFSDASDTVIADPFRGDTSTQPSGSATMIISRAMWGGIERKFTITVPTLTGAYDFGSTADMSYTEQTGDFTFVWKATSGGISVTECSNGGLWLFVPFAAPMSPVASSGATGQFKVTINYRSS